MTKDEMTFLDHLEELRWHIIRSVIVITVLMVVAFISKDIIFHQIMLGPARTDFVTYRLMCRAADAFGIDQLCVKKINFILQSRKIAGQFMAHVTASMVAALVLGAPYLFWEIWRFLKPGLHYKEITATRGGVAAVSILFFVGVLFGYYVLTPLSINFLANYQVDAMIENQFDLRSYISTVLLMVTGAGLLFQLPVVVLVLARLGILTPQLMRKYRRHAIILLMLIAAIITPSPDVFTQLTIGLPLFMLYETSIWVAARAEKKRTREQVARAAKEASEKTNVAKTEG